MAAAESTCWTVLRAAAGGDDPARDQFAARYAPLVRAYLAARWRGSPLVGDLDDAVQEVFVECLRQGGGLDRAEPGRPGGFRAFLYGLVRHVALRFESRRGRRREAVLEGDEPAREDSLSKVFDRAWARSIVAEAAALQESRARQAGAAAERRVALLRLRFHEGLPIREIARRWDADAAELHRQYARARAEFETCLLDILAASWAGDRAEARRSRDELLALLA